LYQLRDRVASPRVAYTVLQPPAFFTVAIRTPLDQQATASISRKERNCHKNLAI